MDDKILEITQLEKQKENKNKKEWKRPTEIMGHNNMKKCPKNPETPIQKNLCTPMFISAQFTIAKSWKQPKCPSANEWIKELWYIYTMEFY